MNCGGFTLLEVVISLGIVMAIIGAFVTIQVLVNQSFKFTFNTSVTVEHANSVTQKMIRAIRTAQASDNGAYALEVLDDQEIVFYADIDNDLQTERVRYFLDGTEIKQGIIEPTGFPVTYPTEFEAERILTELVQNGADPIFYYYNGDWPTDTTNNPLAPAVRFSDTQFVQISLRINADPDRKTQEFTLAPFVQVRNLKDNL